MTRPGFVLVVLVGLAPSAYGDEFFIVTVPPSGAEARGQAASACAAPSSPACEKALKILAKEAADNLHALASTRSRQYRPLVTEYAGVPFPSVRAAAASALGAFGPDAADTTVLFALLNDPVPLVRRNADAALQSSSDENARRIAHRAVGNPGDSLEPQAAPSASGLGVALYPGSTYLFFASEPSHGLYVFATADATGAVETFFAGKGGKALSREELKSLLQTKPNQAQMTGAGMAMAKRYQELMKQGKSPQEIGKLMAAEQQSSMGSSSSPVLGATAESQTFGEPRYYVLAKAEATGLPIRVAAVYQDKALGKTGIMVSVPPAMP